MVIAPRQLEAALWPLWLAARPATLEDGAPLRDVGSLGSPEVLLVCRDWHLPSGVTNHYRNLYEGLGCAGREVMVVVNTRVRLWRRDDFGVVVGLPLLGARTPPRLANMPAIAARWVMAVSSLINNVRPANVICPIVGAQNAAAMLARDGRFITTLHSPYRSDEDGASPRERSLRRAQYEALKYSDVVVANSPTTSRKFAESGPVMIPHGIDDLGTPPPVGWGVVWIGALDWRKGGDRLVDTVAAVRGRVPVHVVLSSGKHDRVLRRRLRDLARLGYVDVHQGLSDAELVALIDGSSAVITTSRFESFGLVALEAARRGRGIVGIQCPGVMDVMPEGEGGMWAVSVPQLADIIVQSPRTVWEQLGARARRRFKENFVKDAMIASFSQLLD